MMRTHTGWKAVELSPVQDGDVEKQQEEAASSGVAYLVPTAISRQNRCLLCLFSTTMIAACIYFLTAAYDLSPVMRGGNDIGSSAQVGDGSHNYDDVDGSGKMGIGVENPNQEKEIQEALEDDDYDLGKRDDDDDNPITDTFWNPATWGTDDRDKKDDEKKESNPSSKHESQGTDKKKKKKKKKDHHPDDDDNDADDASQHGGFDSDESDHDKDDKADGASGGDETAPNEVPVPYPKVTLADGPRFEIVERLEHDPKAFTQGLTYLNGYLYESDGLYGKSMVRKLDAVTGEVLEEHKMDPLQFGEGMAVYRDGDENKLIQLTWKKKIGHIYNLDQLDRPVASFFYATTTTQGWGITVDEARREFIVSDGSHFLHYWSMDVPVEEMGTAEKQLRKLPVYRHDGREAKELNELEFYKNKIFANVWYEDTILVIEPTTGVVEAEYDFKTLWPEMKRTRLGADVLNGISISPEEDILFVTGKLWRWMYRIRLT